MSTPQNSDIAVNVAGFLRGGLGLGEAARLYVRALQSVEVPVRTTSVDVPMPEEKRRLRRRRANPKVAEFADVEDDIETPFNLICVNADELAHFKADVGDAFFAGRRSIGVWAWETDKVPATWAGVFPLVNEIWVYSRYVAEIIGRAAPVPTIRMALPVLAPDPGGASVELVPPDRFTFLFLFDFFSTMQRKNPLGLVEAFRRAFAPGDGPQLLLKSINGDYQPQRMRRVADAAADHPDIHVVDRFLSAAEKDALVGRCDCFVSLHRAEGFGLGMAEAMALGKPVIATGYSGNTDFMSVENSYLVDHGMTTVGPDGDNYPADGVWAEPDLDHAAQMMRTVYGNQDEARRRGERARADIERDFSVQRVGAAMRERLSRLATMPASEWTAPRRAAAVRSTSVEDAPSLAMYQADAKLGFDPVQHAREQGGPANLARIAALKAMRPYTYHQDELNERLAGAIRDTADQLQTLLGRDSADKSGVMDLKRVIEGMRARPASTHPFVAHTDEHGRWVLGFDADAAFELAGYRSFEDVFRGSEELVRERQHRYVELFEGATKVLDVGCGRGEFLDLLAEAGIPTVGVDLDGPMVERCREKGHEVEQRDAIDYLRAAPAGSISGLFAAQVVEHLSAEQLTGLLREGCERLAPGGIAVLETVNPHCPTAMKAFWTDTTHHHPLFPEVLLAHGRLAGYSSGRVLLSEDATTGDFNSDIYASPDYAVVLTAPGV